MTVRYSVVARPAPASVTGDAVYPFPDEVGMAVVARVLLDHVQVDPASWPAVRPAHLCSSVAR